MMFGMDNDDFSQKRDASPDGVAHRAERGINPGNRSETVRLPRVGENSIRNGLAPKPMAMPKRIASSGYVYFDRTQTHIITSHDIRCAVRLDNQAVSRLRARVHLCLPGRITNTLAQNWRARFETKLSQARCAKA